MFVREEEVQVVFGQEVLREEQGYRKIQGFTARGRDHLGTREIRLGQ